MLLKVKVLPRGGFRRPLLPLCPCRFCCPSPRWGPGPSPPGCCAWVGARACACVFLGSRSACGGLTPRVSPLSHQACHRWLRPPPAAFTPSCRAVRGFPAFAELGRWWGLAAGRSAGAAVCALAGLATRAQQGLPHRGPGVALAGRGVSGSGVCCLGWGRSGIAVGDRVAVCGFTRLPGVHSRVLTCCALGEGGRVCGGLLPPTWPSAFSPTRLFLATSSSALAAVMKCLCAQTRSPPGAGPEVQGHGAAGFVPGEARPRSRWPGVCVCACVCIACVYACVYVGGPVGDQP